LKQHFQESKIVMNAKRFAAALLLLLLAPLPATADNNTNLLGFWNHDASKGKVAALIENGTITIFKDIKGWYHAGYRLKASFDGEKIVRTLYSGRPHTLKYRLQGAILNLSADGRSLVLAKVSEPPSAILQKQLRQNWRLSNRTAGEADAKFDGKKIFSRPHDSKQGAKWRLTAILQQVIGDRLIFSIKNMSKGRVGLVIARIEGAKLLFYRYRNDPQPVAIFARE
jgi:hypothetical protein